MKYLFVAVMFWALDGFGQTAGRLIQPVGRGTIKFKSYAEEQAFYRNYGHIIDGFDSSMLCKHIYVSTHRDTVESSCNIQGDYAIGGYGITVPGIVYNVGVHSQKHDEKNISEGINLVCVKCFHQTRQKIHYKHK